MGKWEVHHDGISLKGWFRRRKKERGIIGGSSCHQSVSLSPPIRLVVVDLIHIRRTFFSYLTALLVHAKDLKNRQEVFGRKAATHTPASLLTHPGGISAHKVEVHFSCHVAMSRCKSLQLLRCRYVMHSECRVGFRVYHHHHHY
jgi:hypothetical protein